MTKSKKTDYWSLYLDYSETDLDADMSRYLDVCIEKIGFLPNVIKANSTNNSRLKTFVNFYNRLMIDNNFLSALDKEIIAVVVSSINRCFYCLVSHGAAVRKLSQDNILAEKLVVNYRTAKIEKEKKYMLDFVCKLTEKPYLIEDLDREKLRENNFSEEAIFEIIEVASFFNMTNRIASGTNLLPNKEYYLINR